MVAAQPTKPSDRVLKAALKHARDGSFGESNLVNLEEVAAGTRSAAAAICGATPPRACRGWVRRKRR